VNAGSNDVLVVVEPLPTGRAEGEFIADQREDHLLDDVEV